MSILTAHVLNGKTVGVDLTHYNVITVPFKIELTTPSLGYVDISTIENWWNFADGLQDFSYIRREIKLLINQKGIDACISTLSTPPGSPTDGDQHYIDPLATATGEWTTYEGNIATWDQTNTLWVIEPTDFVGYRLLTITEKLIAAQLKIGSQTDHFTDYGVPAIVDYGFDYHKQSIQAREDRLLRAIVEVYNRLPLNSYVVLSDLTSSPLGDVIGRYEKYGVKGTVEDYHAIFNPSPTPGITDYLYSRAPFDGVQANLDAGFPTGLTLKAWSPIDAANLTEFATEIYNILVYGDATGT